jgi:hypothetical protein
MNITGMFCSTEHPWRPGLLPSPPFSCSPGSLALFSLLYLGHQQQGLESLQHCCQAGFSLFWGWGITLIVNLPTWYMHIFLKSNQYKKTYNEKFPPPLYLPSFTSWTLPVPSQKKKKRNRKWQTIEKTSEIRAGLLVIKSTWAQPNSSRRHKFPLSGMKEGTSPHIL